MSRCPPVAEIAARNLAVLAIAVLAVGCRDSDQLATAPVHGTVTLDGDPLKMGVVIFAPTNGRPAKAKIQADGTYKLGTYDDEDGAILGEHRVAIQARPVVQNESKGAPLVPKFGPSFIPEHYADQETSGLRFTVVEGDNDIDINLSSKAKQN